MNQKAVASATSFRTPFCPVCPTQRNARRKSGLATDNGVEAAKELFGADETYPIAELDEATQYLEKADRIYYHLGRDRAFNETLLKHWQH